VQQMIPFLQSLLYWTLPCYSQHPTNTSKMLCSTCQHIFADWYFWKSSKKDEDRFWGWVTHHQVLCDLRSSAKDLCYICTRLRKTVEADINPLSKSTRPETKNMEEYTDDPFSECRARYGSDTEVSLCFHSLSTVNISTLTDFLYFHHLVR
jgi:hypothetical protein